MNLKALPFLLVIVLGSVKLFFMLSRPSTFDQIGWGMSSIMWAWITWAYWKDKDMPARAGSFKYENGQNNVARTMYVLVMLFCYLLGVVAA